MCPCLFENEVEEIMFDMGPAVILRLRKTPKFGRPVVANRIILKYMTGLGIKRSLTFGLSSCFDLVRTLFHRR